LERTKIDLVALGRPLFADPELPNKSRAGKFKEIRPCLRCSKGAAVWPEDMRCVGNPAVGKERLFEEKLRPTGTPKNILVIGAGPGGMEAARICAIRGHNVTMAEKQKQIGGKILITMNQPHKEYHGRWLQFYREEMARLVVVVELGKEISVQDVQALNPDAVIVATGSTPLIPKGIYGMDTEGVVTTDDVLLGRTTVGEKVAIIGGSSMGVETAEFIFEQGDHDVVVVEQLPKILSDISHDAELALMDKLMDKKFRALDSTKVEGIEKKGDKIDIKILRYNQEHILKGFDTVVIAVGVKPLNEFGLKLKESRENVFLVGDCEGPGDYRKAIHDAAGIAIEL
jgi:pyruvate/2-oxoglutarate dehydrogenase complex dihydrolipoamide dehydrogenase (E3) component